MDPLTIAAFAMATGALIVSNVHVIFINTRISHLENSNEARRKIVELFSVPEQ